MLFADKAALENRTKVKLLTIRERELTLYTNNCRTVGTVSALMAGIAYSALVSLPDWRMSCTCGAQTTCACCSRGPSDSESHSTSSPPCLHICSQIYTKMSYFQESAIVAQFLYILGIVVCMCLSLKNVLGTTMLTMLGPGKALRGPDGSMHTAVDGMRIASNPPTGPSTTRCMPPSMPSQPRPRRPEPFVRARSQAC